MFFVDPVLILSARIIKAIESYNSDSKYFNFKLLAHETKNILEHGNAAVNACLYLIAHDV